MLIGMLYKFFVRNVGGFQAKSVLEKLLLRFIVVTPCT
jgi:hypothetical protein